VPVPEMQITRNGTIVESRRPPGRGFSPVDVEAAMRIGKRFPLLLALGFGLASPFAQAQKQAHSEPSAAPTQRPSTNTSSNQPATAHQDNGTLNVFTSRKPRSSPKIVDTSVWSPRVFANFSPTEPRRGASPEFARKKPVKVTIPPKNHGPVGTGGGASGGGSGLYLLGGEGGYVVPSDDSVAQSAGDQGPVEDATTQDPGGEQDQTQPIEALDAKLSATESEQTAATPVQDEGEFTLVLRDGSRVSALAFTHASDKIIYISPDGDRRTLASVDLDADATVRVNQERGTPLQLPL
jgi:hypothetical protein